MIRAKDLAKLINSLIETHERKKGNIVKYAKIDPNYTSGRPSLIFDGETETTIKNYPYLSSYVPAANDRVQLIGGVIQGKIN